LLAVILKGLPLDSKKEVLGEFKHKLANS